MKFNDLSDEVIDPVEFYGWHPESLGCNLKVMYE
jgi:hypothetical protein